MGFNLLGAIGGAIGGLFTGGPIGAAVGGIEGGLSGSAPSNPVPTANSLLPMLPPPPDTISSELGAVQPLEDLGIPLDRSLLGDLSADSADEMASIAAPA
jgi:hypothetical protein